jgi:hypothetical protein
MIPNLSKDMIDLMQQLRKRLRSEFNADLKLSQPDIIDVILTLVERSRDQRTQLLFADREDMIGMELRSKPVIKENSVTASDSQTLMYRGQSVVVSKRPLDTEKASSSHSSTKVYRGQIVA